MNRERSTDGPQIMDSQARRSDIVSRLRYEPGDYDYHAHKLMSAAADEIERLRDACGQKSVEITNLKAVLVKVRAENQKLRADAQEIVAEWEGADHKWTTENQRLRAENEELRAAIADDGDWGLR